MDELKEMQTQLALLKQSLSESRITNQNLIKKVISQKISTLNRIVWVEVIMNPILILLITSFCIAKGISLWFPAIFLVASIIDVVLDFKTMRFSPKEMATSSLVTVKKRLLKQKKQRKLQTIVMTPLALIWVMCLFVAILRPYDLKGIDLTIGWIGAGIVLITTLVVILWLNRRIDGTTDEMVSDINSMDGEQ